MRSGALFTILAVAGQVYADSSTNVMLGSGALVARANKATVDGYTYLGCFSDDQSPRPLGVGISQTDSMTLESCAPLCASYVSGQNTGLPYMGVEYSRECYCDCAIQTNLPPVDDSNCNYPCSGDGSETCGGDGYMSIYMNNNYTTCAPTSSSASNGNTDECANLSVNGTSYTYGTDTFNMTCGQDAPGNDIMNSGPLLGGPNNPVVKGSMSITVNNFETCMQACTLVDGCVAAVWIPKWLQCYYKSDVKQFMTQAYVVDSGILLPGLQIAGGPTTVTMLSTYTYNYFAGNPTETVTVVLLEGPASNLQPVYTITSAVSSSFTWVPPATLASNTDYALEIVDATTTNYYGPVTIVPPVFAIATPTTTSTSSSSSPSTSTVAVPTTTSPSDYTSSNFLSSDYGPPTTTSSSSSSSSSTSSTSSSQNPLVSACIDLTGNCPVPDLGSTSSSSTSQSSSSTATGAPDYGSQTTSSASMTTSTSSMSTSSGTSASTSSSSSSSSRTSSSSTSSTTQSSSSTSSTSSSTTSISTSRSSSSTSSSSSSSSTPVTPNTLSNAPLTIERYGYLGCYTALINQTPLLSTPMYATNPNTLESCTHACSIANYAIAGMLGGQQCWCGRALSDGSPPNGRVAEANCNLPCAGNSTETCGGVGSTGADALPYGNTYSDNPNDCFYNLTTGYGVPCTPYYYIPPGSPTSSSSGSASSNSATTSSTFSSNAYISSMPSSTYGPDSPASYSPAYPGGSGGGSGSSGTTDNGGNGGYYLTVEPNGQTCRVRNTVVVTTEATVVVTPASSAMTSASTPTAPVGVAVESYDSAVYSLPPSAMYEQAAPSGYSAVY